MLGIVRRYFPTFHFLSHHFPPSPPTFPNGTPKIITSFHFQFSLHSPRRENRSKQSAALFAPLFAAHLPRPVLHNIPFIPHSAISHFHYPNLSPFPRPKIHITNPLIDIKLANLLGLGLPKRLHRHDRRARAGTTRSLLRLQPSQCRTTCRKLRRRRSQRRSTHLNSYLWREKGH